MGLEVGRNSIGEYKNRGKGIICNMSVSFLELIARVAVKSFEQYSEECRREDKRIRLQKKCRRIRIIAVIAILVIGVVFFYNCMRWLLRI